MKPLIAAFLVAFASTAPCYANNQPPALTKPAKLAVLSPKVVATPMPDGRVAITWEGVIANSTDDRFAAARIDAVFGDLVYRGVPVPCAPWSHTKAAGSVTVSADDAARVNVRETVLRVELAH